MDVDVCANAAHDNTRNSSTSTLLRPLNPKRRRERLAVKDSYLEYFNLTSFKKGWAKPLLNIDEVEEAFDLAAEIVVRVRRELDQSGATHQARNLRLTGGGAREFLHQVESTPQEDLDAFVRNLVQATFKDQNGLVEGLTVEKLDKWITEVKAEHAKAEHSQSTQVAHQLRTLAASISQKLRGLTEQPLSNEKLEKVTREHLLNLHRLLKMLHSVDAELDLVIGRAAEDKQSPAVAAEKSDILPSPTDPCPVSPATGAAASVEGTTAEEKMEVTDTTKEPEAMTIEPAAASFEEKRAEQQLQTFPAKKADEEHNGAEKQVEDVKQDEKAAAATPASKDTGSGSDSEAHARVLPHTVMDNAHMLKIKKVQEEFDTLRHDALDLAADAEKIHPEQFRDDVEGGIRKLDLMQRRCMELAHLMMKELLTLDDMVGMTADARPARKAQVERIQQTLDDVELLQRKISAMISQVREEEAKSKRVPKLKDLAQKVAEKKASDEKQRLEEERQREEERKQKENERLRLEAAEKSKTAEETKEGASPEAQTKKQRAGGKWQQLRLRPEFESKEHSDAYSVSAYIPGMRQDDIELNLGPNGSSLEIRGCRYPSQQEETAMRRQLQQLRTRETHGRYYPSQEGDEVALLRLGAGRYGSFAQAFNLPKGIDVGNISASYEGGVLRVVLPKVPQVRRRVPAYDPYAAYAPGRRSFLDTDDAWW